MYYRVIARIGRYAFPLLRNYFEIEWDAMFLSYQHGSNRKGKDSRSSGMVQG